MRTRLIALLAVAAFAAPAAAGHKPPISEKYDVTAPVPYPVEGASHCTDGIEGTTKNTRPVTLPDQGVLVIELSGFLGDWVLELHDDKGRMLGQAAALEPTNTAPVRKLTFKKAKPGMKVKIAVCNNYGGPKGSVKYTFTYR